MKVSIPVYAIQNLNTYKKEGILISGFAHYAARHQHLHHAHRHTFYHLVYFTSGSGSHQIDFQTFEVKKGHLYFMAPGQVHSWNFDYPPDGFVINFSSDYFQSFLLKADYVADFHFFSGQVDEQVLQLSEELQEKMKHLFEELLTEATAEAPEDMVRVLLLRLLITLSTLTTHTQAKKESGTYNYRLLKNFQSLIEENFRELHLPKQYAALLYITPNHLNALCNDLLAVSAGTLIRQRILLEAKRMLVNQSFSVAAIAESLHFKDLSYFVRFFKKYEEITPDKFRKLNSLTHETSPF